MSGNGWESLRDEVAAAGGLKTVEMRRLREAIGRERLGIRLLEPEIADELPKVDLGVLGDLSVRAKDKVRLYVRSSAIGQIVEALQDDSPGADFTLQRFGKLADRIAVLRALICPESSRGDLDGELRELETLATVIRGRVAAIEELV